MCTWFCRFTSLRPIDTHGPGGATALDDDSEVSASIASIGRHLASPLTVGEPLSKPLPTAPWQAGRRWEHWGRKSKKGKGRGKGKDKGPTRWVVTEEVLNEICQIHTADEDFLVAGADGGDDAPMDDSDDAQVTILVSPRLPELLSPLRPHVVHQVRDWLRRNFTVEELDLIVG